MCRKYNFKNLYFVYVVETALSDATLKPIILFSLFAGKELPCYLQEIQKSRYYVDKDSGTPLLFFVCNIISLHIGYFKVVNLLQVSSKNHKYVDRNININIDRDTNYERYFIGIQYPSSSV